MQWNKSILMRRSRKHSRIYRPELASYMAAWFSEHFNCHRLKCSLHQATFHEASLLLVFSTVESTNRLCRLFWYIFSFFKEMFFKLSFFNDFHGLANTLFQFFVCCAPKELEKILKTKCRLLFMSTFLCPSFLKENLH